jgi:hypothetical protein
MLADITRMASAGAKTLLLVRSSVNKRERERESMSGG